MNWKERFRAIKEDVKRREAIELEAAKIFSKRIEAIKSFADDHVDFEEVAKMFIGSLPFARIESISKYSFSVRTGDYLIGSSVCLKAMNYFFIPIDSDNICTRSVSLDLRERNSRIQVEKIDVERGDDSPVFSKTIPLATATNDKLAKLLVEAYF